MAARMARPHPAPHRHRTRARTARRTGRADRIGEHRPGGATSWLTHRGIRNRRRALPALTCRDVRVPHSTTRSVQNRKICAPAPHCAPWAPAARNRRSGALVCRRPGSGLQQVVTWRDRLRRLRLSFRPSAPAARGCLDACCRTAATDTGGHPPGDNGWPAWLDRAGFCGLHRTRSGSAPGFRRPCVQGWAAGTALGTDLSVLGGLVARALWPPSAMTALAVTRWYRSRSWVSPSASERCRSEPIVNSPSRCCAQVTGEVHPVPDRFLQLHGPRRGDGAGDAEFLLARCSVRVRSSASAPSPTTPVRSGWGSEARRNRCASSWPGSGDCPA